MIGSTCVGVPASVDVVPGGGHIGVLVITVVVGIKALITAQCRVAIFATHLTRHFVAVAVSTSTASTTTTAEATISSSAHRATTTPTAMEGSIGSDLLLLPL
jgi:hypothetical protein